MQLSSLVLLAIPLNDYAFPLMIHCTYSSVCKSVIVKFILPNLLKTLSSSVIGVQPNLFARMSALVLLCIDGFTGFQNRLFCICTLICHLVRVKLLNTVFFPFIELEIPGALDSYPWRRMRMLMQQFVLVTRLSGMVGSFLWRSRRHLHGESSTLEPHVPLFKRDLIASLCTDFTGQKT